MSVTLEQFMSTFRERASSTEDKQLLALLDKYADEIVEWFECSTPEKSSICTKFPVNASEWHGYNFHKGFRAIGVVDSTPGVDSEIWSLIRESDGFWKAHHELFNYECTASELAA
jgi:hypothetical protein